jgi:hypothetical protein
MHDASSILKVFHPHLIYVTCLAHGLNRLAKQIGNYFLKVNSFISNMKKLFCKVPSKIVAFKNLPSALGQHSSSQMAGKHGLRQLNAIAENLKLLKNCSVISWNRYAAFIGLVMTTVIVKEVSALHFSQQPSQNYECQEYHCMT